MTSEQEKYYNKIVNKYTRSFGFIIKKEKIEIITLEIFNAIYGTYSRINTMEIFKNVDIEVKKYINKYIINKLQEDPYLVIDSFINVKMNSKDLKKLIKFFNNFNYIPDIDLIEKLIKENKIINDILTDVVSKNIYRIKNGYLDSVSTDEIIISMIEVYCLINNIEIKEIKEDDDSLLDYDNEDDNYKVESAITWYLNQIRSIKILSREEEKEYGRRLKDGDLEARKKLVEHNLPFVVSIAKKKQCKNMLFEDLIQGGNLGLIRAAEKFDVDKGFRFSTYAKCWIRQSIDRTIINQGRNIRIPVIQYEAYTKYKTIEDEMTMENQKEPTPEEVAKRIGFSEKKLKNILNIPEDSVSYNIPTGENEEDEVIDVLPDTEYDFIKNIINEELNNAIQKIFDNCNLNDREKNVLILRFYNNLTLQQVGDIYGITREAVRRNEATALRKIRQSNYGNVLTEYTDVPEKAKENLEIYKYVYDNIKIADNSVSEKQFEEGKKELRKIKNSKEK